MPKTMTRPLTERRARGGGKTRGRPRSSWSDLAAVVGAPPADPLALVGWLLRAMATDVVLYLERSSGARSTRGEELRAALRLAARVERLEVIYQAEQAALRAEERAL